MAAGRSALRSELRPEIAALDERGRRFRQIAGWTALSAVLLFAVSMALSRNGHLTIAGFGGLLQAPDALAPILAAENVELSKGHRALRTEASLALQHAWVFLKTIGVIIGGGALFRRQWALAAVAAGVWLLPYDLVTRQPPPGATAVLTSELADWKRTYLEPLSAADKSPKRLYPDDRTEILPAKHQFTLDDAPPELRREMAYLLAQVAYIERDPTAVAANLEVMGRDYPQQDRVTRRRVQSMNAYVEHEANLAPPGPPSRAGLSYKVANPVSRGFLLLGLIVLLGGLATGVVGGRIATRVRRLKAIQPTLALQAGAA